MLNFPDATYVHVFKECVFTIVMSKYMHLYVLYFDAYSVQRYVYGRREWMQSRVIPERPSSPH